MAIQLQFMQIGVISRNVQLLCCTHMFCVVCAIIMPAHGCINFRFVSFHVYSLPRQILAFIQTEKLPNHEGNSYDFLKYVCLCDVCDLTSRSSSISVNH